MENTVESLCFVCSADPGCCQRVDRLLAAYSGWNIVPIGDPAQLRATLQDARSEYVGRAALVLSRHDAATWQLAALIAMAIQAASVPTLVITTFAPLFGVLAEQGISIAAQVAPQDSDVAWQQALARLLVTPSPKVDTRPAHDAQELSEIPLTQTILRDHPLLVWDTSVGTLIRDGEVISLTPREHALLEILARAPGRVFSAATLAQLITRPEAPYPVQPHAVEQAISRLRQKVGDRTASVPLLACRPGFGYLLTRHPGQRIAVPAPPATRPAALGRDAG